MSILSHDTQHEAGHAKRHTTPGAQTFDTTCHSIAALIVANSWSITLATDANPAWCAQDVIQAHAPRVVHLKKHKLWPSHCFTIASLVQVTNATARSIMVVGPRSHLDRAEPLLRVLLPDEQLNCGKTTSRIALGAVKGLHTLGLWAQELKLSQVHSLLIAHSGNDSGRCTPQQKLSLPISSRKRAVLQVIMRRVRCLRREVLQLALTASSSAVRSRLHANTY
eukprot:3208075-Amphidinium_carterae.1